MAQPQASLPLGCMVCLGYISHCVISPQAGSPRLFCRLADIPYTKNPAILKRNWDPDNNTPNTATRQLFIVRRYGSSSRRRSRRATFGSSRRQSRTSVPETKYASCNSVSTTETRSPSIVGFASQIVSVADAHVGPHLSIAADR
ncbi:hypothetical protein CC78DRAFT_535444 [Lojkania enalia]|uniref:Uncharacterized protein n=1 Tax=Lojkania enalia TaxID=147567 RepID=A0A9P4N0U3_9PLEO|nr:hypothetical protein CC78DRAFT_535444 [Didymosphaeria enalia]